ncbi:Pre-rRNA-processing protein IPI3 [Rhodotorula diobovata]|uniref:Pre-rRNA-processing protein IPI3 n=1 Tax=Rhodotorula diobovata TaxID=5288 RepID=A0A5C5FT28_9BASI|nr:Pre-rRNA-processing protein IPI3 [Rhodotorula diobovata]
MAHHQPSNTAAPLSELVLSSTASASPLPTLSLHHPLTGALVYSFRAPVANSNIATTGGAPGSARSKGKDAQDEGQSLDGRRTLALVEGANGMGGFIAGLGGKDGRAGLNVWNFTRETTQHRLIPPVRLSTMTVSRDGLYMAGGTPDGRVFLWEVSSGNLLVTVDAHYRAVSALEFSDDGAALVSASEDAGVCVWAIGRLLAATPMNPPAPFATLSDHTLAVTDVRVGLGTFPHCRVMTASMDSTVKIWDISTSPASLLSTFAFPHPVTHIAWDSLERFFFAAGPSSSPSSSTSAASSSSAPTDPAPAAAAPCGSRVVRVNLYRKRRDEFGIEVAEPVGGGGRGEVERVAAGAESGREGEVYEIADTITALHLSPYSPTLLVGTSTTQTHVLSLPSLLPSRILVPPPSSTSPGPITFLSTLLRPSELGASSSGSSSAAAAGPTDLPQRAIMPQGMGRTVVPPSERERGGPNARTVDVRLGAARDVADLLSPAVGLSPFALSLAGVGAGAGAGVGVGAGAGADALDRERRRAGELEREVEALKRQLGRAVGQSERVWSRAVEGALNGRGGGEAR